MEGFWQDVVPTLHEEYDSIVFDTFEMCADERGIYPLSFVPHAARLLRPSGAFAYYPDADLSLISNRHLDVLFAHFDRVGLHRVTGLLPRPDTDYWRSTEMIVPVAELPRAR